MKKQQSRHSVRNNTFLSLLISGIGYLYPVLVFIYIARIFHPEGLGRISFVSSVTAYFVMFTGLGMPIYGLRIIAVHQDDRQKLSQLTAEMILIRFFSGVAVWVVFLLTRQLFSWQDEQCLLMIYGLGVLAAIPECTWLFKGMEDYSTLAWTSAVGRLGALAVMFIFVRQASDISKYAWIAVPTPMTISVAELIWADRKWGLHVFSQCSKLIRSKGVFSAVRKHIRPLTLFMMMSCAVTIYTHTDTVMLGLMRGERTVGLYSCAAKAKSILPVLTGALWAAALPKSAELWKNRLKTEFREFADRSFHIIYVVMLPLTVYFFLFAEPWMLLIGGEDYLDAVWTMRLLLLAVIPIGFSNIIGGQMLIPAGHEKKLFQAEAVGAAVNIILNLILIPVLSSAGAAIATTVSEILVTLVALSTMQKLVKFHIFQPKSLLNSIIGCVVAGLITIGITTLFRMSPLLEGFVSFAVYILLFSLLMLLFRDPLYSDQFKDARKLYRRVVPDQIRIQIGKPIRQIRSLYFRTDAKVFQDQMKYYCPCCETRLRTFAEGDYVDYPEKYDHRRYVKTRQDVICPVCGALPRHRILAIWCDKHRSDLQSSDILYFAPEISMMRWMKCNSISCTTADLYAPANLRLDIQATGLSDECFDVVFCNHVLEHVDDFRMALKELYRILRPGGRLICSFPMDPGIDLVDEETEKSLVEERVQRFGQYDHKRVFGMNADQMLSAAGFTVEKISGENCPENILPVIGPGDYDINLLFDCRKS